MHLPNPQLLTALRRLPDPATSDALAAAHQAMRDSCVTRSVPGWKRLFAILGAGSETRTSPAALAPCPALR